VSHAAVLAQTPTAVPAQAPAAPAGPPAEPALTWHRPALWGVEGRAWTDKDRLRWYDRLPAIAEGKVTDAVWNLSRDSAGMIVRFKTDATTIWANYTLRKDQLAIPNMTAMGASGIDLYARGDDGKWRWVAVTRPNAKVVRQFIANDLTAGFREYAAYLPLWNGVDELALGVPPGAKFEPLPPRNEQPIVFYGTSITHGASASRPGMTHVAILGRRLDRHVVNLGFSGNGRMDAAVGELLVKIDAAAYIIDCLPNMQAPLVRERCIPLVKQIRAARPDTPIVLVEDRRFTNSWARAKQKKLHDDNHAALREAFETLQKEGVKNLYYLPGSDLLGADGEGTTDGSHPNDLGFVRQADAFEPVLRAALGMRPH
jgi:hypothetical protein